MFSILDGFLNSLQIHRTFQVMKQFSLGNIRQKPKFQFFDVTNFLYRHPLHHRYLRQFCRIFNSLQLCRTLCSDTVPRIRDIKVRNTKTSGCRRCRRTKNLKKIQHTPCFMTYLLQIQAIHDSENSQIRYTLLSIPTYKKFHRASFLCNKIWIETRVKSFQELQMGVMMKNSSSEERYSSVHFIIFHAYQLMNFYVSIKNYNFDQTHREEGHFCKKHFGKTMQYLLFPQIVSLHLQLSIQNHRNYS